MSAVQLPPNFSLIGFNEWVNANKPLHIDLTDKEYTRLCALKRFNVKEWFGIPIRHLDGPRDVVQ